MGEGSAARYRGKWCREKKKKKKNICSKIVEVMVERW